jgi:hypothetical protein
VATFMLANEGSNRNYPGLALPDGHHEISHHGGDEAKQAAIARINRYHLELFAGFLRRLSDTPSDAGQNLLDDTLVVYGGAIADGNSHAHQDLPILLAGGGSRLAQGRHRRFAPETSLARLHGALLELLGVPGEALPTRRFHAPEPPLVL